MKLSWAIIADESKLNKGHSQFLTDFQILFFGISSDETINFKVYWYVYSYSVIVLSKYNTS